MTKTFEETKKTHLECCLTRDLEGLSITKADEHGVNCVGVHFFEEPPTLDEFVEKCYYIESAIDMIIFMEFTFKQAFFHGLVDFNDYDSLATKQKHFRTATLDYFGAQTNGNIPDEAKFHDALLEFGRSLFEQ